VKPIFLGSHPATDFFNTRPTPRGVPIELIGDGASFLSWLEGAGLLQASAAAKVKRRRGAEALDAAAAEARELREWAREWMQRWRDAPGGDYRVELRRLNGVLERTSFYRQLVAGRNGLRVEERSRVDSPDDMITLVASPIASLVATEDPSLVKRCQGSGCTLWFLDRTKAHGRLFCSTAACGNRARVAAFRERQKDDAARRRARPLRKR
jgi:predicted RNA-binding Zn ribbon-like protein